MLRPIRRGRTHRGGHPGTAGWDRRFGEGSPPQFFRKSKERPFQAAPIENLKGNLRFQGFQGRQPGAGFHAAFVVVGGHAEEVLNVRRAGEEDAPFHRLLFQKGEAFQGVVLHFVAVGLVVERFLELPQVVFPGDGHEEDAAGLQYPPVFLPRIGGEQAGDQVKAPVRQGQPENAGGGALRALAAAGAFVGGVLGDIRCEHFRRAAGLPQRAQDGGGVIPLPAAGVQHRRGGDSGQVFRRSVGKRLRQGRIVPPVQEIPAGVDHELVVSGNFGALFIDQKQVDIPAAAPVVCVAGGTAQAVPNRRKRFPAEGAEPLCQNMIPPFLLTPRLCAARLWWRFPVLLLMVRLSAIPFSPGLSAGCRLHPGRKGRRNVPRP